MSIGVEKLDADRGSLFLDAETHVKASTRSANSTSTSRRWRPAQIAEARRMARSGNKLDEAARALSYVNARTLLIWSILMW